MPVAVPEIDYYSLHGMWGAHASLVLGRLGRGAGVVVGDVQPPNRGLFVGYRRGYSDPRLLPFSPGVNVGLGAEAYREDFVPAKPVMEKANYAWFKAEEIERSVSFSGEIWQAGLVKFRVLSFFGEVPDPSSGDIGVFRSRVRPSLLIQLDFDNSQGTDPLIGFFGMQGVRRPLSDVSHGALLGFASGNTWGFAALPEDDVEEVMDWSAVDAAFNGNRPLRRLAAEGGLRYRVEAGEKRHCLLAVGVFRDGILTSGCRTHAYHASLFKDLEEVLESALVEAGEALTQADRLDAILDNAPLSDDRKFLIAHAAHSYNASTELLLRDNGDPLFVVNEGEYRMMNTLDLTVDQAFWELRWSPWTVRNELESFWERSAYEDRFGIAFAHDQGVADCFTPIGSSCYEIPGLSECFSFMSYEETVNWVLTACLYTYNSGDETWALSRLAALSACLRSLLARDQNNDGIMDIDSDRCAGGAEITTYDSLDVSLGQARNNLYLAVKAWAAFVCLDALFQRLSGSASPDAARARSAAALAARSISERFISGENYIPAVFESENRSKIIPAIEGLVYPAFCGIAEAVTETGPYADLITTLRSHFDNVLTEGVCLDAVSGGWKLSSTSNNTWLSKIFINQYVAETILKVKDDRTSRDSVHARWQRTGSADWAATDQVDSSSGCDLGSRLYPRLVSSILWLYPPAGLKL